MKTYICIGAFLLVFLGMTACSNERREFTNYEPGEYKGKTDPLLAQGEHPGLKDRVMMGQTDR